MEDCARPSPTAITEVCLAGLLLSSCPSGAIPRRLIDHSGDLLSTGRLRVPIAIDPIHQRPVLLAGCDTTAEFAEHIVQGVGARAVAATLAWPSDANLLRAALHSTVFPVYGSVMAASASRRQR